MSDVTLESLFSGLLDIVEHLVNTHTVWNNGISQEDATAKVAECRNALTINDDAPTETEGK